jgi:hypothetical protein
MSNVISTNFSYTYDGLLTTDLLIKPAIENPDLKALFRTMYGIKSKKQLNLVNPLGHMTAAASGCDNEVTGDTTLITNRELEVAKLYVKTPFCPSDFANTIMETATGFGLSEDDLTDPSGRAIQQVIQKLVVEAVNHDIFALASFGDSTSNHLFYGSGVDGLWTRMIAGTSDYCVRKTASLGTGALADGAALTALRATYSGATNLLKQVPAARRKFFVTQSVFENLQTSYESVTAGSDLQFQYLQDGTTVIRFRGLPVIPIVAWDALLEQSGNPLNGVVEHLILYTDVQNHVIGAGDPSDDTNFRFWHSMDDNVNYMQMAYRLGYNYVHCDLQAVAY